MATTVITHDFSHQVRRALQEHIEIALTTAANEMTSQVKRETRPSDYWPKDVRGSWSYIVDRDKREAVVGSPLVQAFWEELGTGEYAVYGNGRKGWWVYVEGNTTPTRSFEALTKEEAERRAAYLQEQGLDAHISNGTPPNRPMLKAFDSHRDSIVAIIESELKRLEDERNG